MSKIFQLTWATYDSATDHHFEAPEGATQESFKELCDRLMRQAAEDVLKGVTNVPWLKEQGRSPLETWIGYDRLVDEVSWLLEGHGYKRVRLPEVTYTHGMIIRRKGDDHDGVLGPELEARICAANERLEKNLNENRKARRQAAES